MNINCIGLFISIIYIGLVLSFSILIKKKTSVSDETVRKIIHILSANWWLILIFYIKNPLFALIGPIVFLFVDSLFIFYPQFGKHIGCPKRNRNYGLVYYPFSLIILIAYSYLGTLSLSAATIGVFCMGYGDGFAALFGSKFGKKKIPLPTGGKTYLGSLVMAIVCFISSFLILIIMSDLLLYQIISYSIIISICATLIEVITPLGLDNISVPIISALIAGGLI
jgi:phytol kinase